MKFDYYMPSRLLFGAGKLQELHKHKLPGTKALIVMTAARASAQTVLSPRWRRSFAFRAQAQSSTTRSHQTLPRRRL